MKLKNLFEKKFYVGSCVETDYFSDATEMAQAVENGVEISSQEFLSNVNTDTILMNKIKKASFWKNEDLGVYWAYDFNKDIHYFWA